METKKPILKINKVSKHFPGVRALDEVDFYVNPGEVHALIGENGAGKSTLMKIILGTYKMTSGTMELKGEAYAPANPLEALQKGISMIHQEINLIPTFSVSDNIWIGREGQFSQSGKFYNRAAQREATLEILRKLNLNIDPDVEASYLSVAEMQMVEIARAVSYNADIVIMDEPTSALTNNEIDKLYSIISDLKSQGKSVIFISHKLDEIFRICDSITVFRDGHFIERHDIGEITQNQLIKLMVGRELTNIYPKVPVNPGEKILEVKDISGDKFHHVSFDLREGEILGFAGLVGAGRTEIMQAIFGIDAIHSGEILLRGKKLKNTNAKKAILNKFAMVTEDRRKTGIIQLMSVHHNTSLAYLREITHHGFVDRSKENEDVERITKELAVKTPSLSTEIALLSGGNQQKVIVGKWLLTGPDVLILDEPTRGIDVGAKAEIYKLIGNMAKSGKAIIVVSSELPELMGISDRICVVRGGTIVGEFERPEFDQEKIMQRAFGVQ